MKSRNTIQRSLVLEAVNKLRCHATADQIYDEIVKDHPTMYRNLTFLAEKGEIRRLEIPGGADCFDHRCHDHCHVKCEKCGRVFDVDMEFVTGLEKGIQNDHGFAFTGYEILFHGVCPDCQRSPQEKL